MGEIDRRPNGRRVACAERQHGSNRAIIATEELEELAALITREQLLRHAKDHRGHQYGTLDTIHEWDWSGYTAHRIASAS
jgi:hypothetical protein